MEVYKRTKTIICQQIMTDYEIEGISPTTREYLRFLCRMWNPENMDAQKLNKNIQLILISILPFYLTFFPHVLVFYAYCLFISIFYVQLFLSIYYGYNAIQILSNNPGGIVLYTPQSRQSKRDNAKRKTQYREFHATFVKEQEQIDNQRADSTYNFVKDCDWSASIVPTDNDALFASHFRGKPTPNHLLRIRMADVPALLGSITNFKMFETIEERKKYDELLRQIKALPQYSEDPESSIACTRHIIHTAYSEFSSIVLKPQAQYYLPKHIEYDEENAPQTVSFHAKHFISTYTKKGKLLNDPLLVVNEGPNQLYYFFGYHDNFAHCHTMSFARTKSIIRSLCAAKVSKEEILECISRKLYVLAPREKLCSKLSWITSYMSPEVYYYGIRNEEKFMVLFREYVKLLKDYVMKFARQYLDVSELTRKERKEAYESRVSTFRDIMRTPAIQMLFIQGYTKDFITRYINMSFRTQLKQAVMKSESYVGSKELKAYKRETSIAHARFEKGKVETDLLFEPQMHPGLELENDSQGFWTFLFKYGRHLKPIRWTLVFAFATFVWTLSMISWFCTYLWRMIKRWNEVFTRADQTLDEIDGWSRALSNPLSVLDSKTLTNLALEVKCIIHAGIHLIHGNKTEALAWLSNLLFTRQCFAKVISVVRGIPDRVQEGQFVPESKNFGDIIGTIHSVVQELGFTHITDADIRMANSRMQHSSNIRKEAESKYNAVYTVASILCRLICGYDPIDAIYNGHTAKVLQIISYVDGLNLHENNIFTVPGLTSMINYYKAGSDLLVDPQTLNVPSFIRDMFKQRMNLLGAATKRASYQLGKGTDRREPTSILLTGPPGVGKSAFMNFAQKAICWIMGVPFDPLCSYTYSATTEYWEGYTNQRFVVMDDMFKEADVDIRLRQAQDMISMINTAPMPLNMAFEGKGNSFFDSEFVFCTTNIANDGIDKATLQVNLTDPAALRRRFHLVLHRDRAITENHLQDTFRVDQCALMPEVCGNLIMVSEIPKLICQLRNKQLGMREAYMIKDETLQALYGEFIPQALPEAHVDPVALIRLALKNLSHVPAMIDPTMRNLVIAVFFLCIIISRCGPMYNYFFGYETQSWPDGIKTGKTMQVRKRVQLTKAERAFGVDNTGERPNLTLHAQSSEDYNRAIRNNIANAVVYLYGEGKSGHNPVGMNAIGFHIRDGFMCTPAHFYMYFDNIEECELTMRWGTREVTIPWPSLALRLNDDDLVLFKLPQMDRPPEVYRYMLRGQDFYEVPEGDELTVISAHDTGEPNIMPVHKYNIDTKVTYESIGHTMLVVHAIGYNCKTVKGDSGALVMRETVHGKPSLVAMHVAATGSGETRIGVSTIIWKELIDDMIGTMCPPMSEPFPHEVLRTVRQDQSHVPPHSSRIKRSLMFGCFPEPIEKVPARLSPFTNDDGEYKLPLYIAMKKMHQTPSECPPVDDRCLDYLWKLYPPIVGAKVLSPMQALSEYDCPGYVPVNFGTSPGYPYSLRHGKGKGPYIFRDDRDKLQFQPEFLVKLEEYHNQLKKGKQIEVLWADVLKDETRPLAKVHAGKTRLFSTCPLHYLILNRMYFQDFVLYIHSLAATHPVSVGLNVGSLQWRVLYQRLAQKAGSVLSGDYENYDGMLPTCLAHKFVKFVNRWYNDGPVNARVRELLMEHIYKAMHICYTKVYQVFDGNPSGNPMTSIYNSFCNMMMLFIVLTEDLGLGERDFEMAVYGDDNVVCIDRPGIRCSNIAPHIKRRFNMTYTHFSKVESEEHDTLDTIRYLGRNFILIEGVLRAQLSMAVIREIPYWKFSSTSESLFLQSASDSMFREMSHYPREEFEHMVSEYMKQVSIRAPDLRLLISKQLLTYDGYKIEMYSDPKMVTHKPFERLACEHGRESPCPSWEIQSHSSTFAAKAGVVNEVTTTQNLEYTDRATNELVATQQFQLGQAQDAAPVSASAMNSQVLQIPYQVNNMEVFDLNRSIDRLYTLANPAWTTAQAANTVIGTYNFPDVLFAQDFIANKKNDFSHFRAGIRFVVRCTTSGFNYGTIMVIYQPDINADGFLTRGTNVYTASGFPHLLVSAAQSEAAVLDVPFIYPKRFIPAKNPVAGSMGRFVVMVLNPLININGGVDSAQLTIQAQFVDAELVLPRDSAQSNPGLKRETQRKSRAGIMSANLEDHAATGESLDIVRFSKPYTDFFRTVRNTVGTALEIGTLLGLSKPTSVENPSSMTLDVVSTFNYGKGIDQAKKFAMDPEAAIATRPLVGGIDQDEMDLKYVMGTPMMTSTFAMVAATPPVVIGTTSPFALLGAYTYVDFVTRNFAFCSGSYKFAAYIEASNLHAVRLVFYLATTDAADYQDCYHRIVDVQGSTYVTFTVPHCVTDFARDTTTETTYWAVYVKILSWSQPTPAVSAPVYFNVYKAAASDFKVGCLLDMKFTPQSNPRKDFANVFDPLHPSMMGYEPNAVVYPEEYTTIREIIHRMYPHFSGDTCVVYGPAGTPRIGLELWGTIYMYFRGSIRVQALRKQQAGGLFPVSGLFLERTDGTAGNIPGLDVGFASKPSLSGEAPWYSNLAFKSTTVAQAPTYQFNVPDATGDSFFCKSAGDDFTYMFLCPPPAGILAPTNGANGYTGLKTWLTT